jgi:hypothetical protein
LNEKNNVHLVHLAYSHLHFALCLPFLFFIVNHLLLLILEFLNVIKFKSIIPFALKSIPLLLYVKILCLWALPQINDIILGGWNFSF